MVILLSGCEKDNSITAEECDLSKNSNNIESKFETPDRYSIAVQKPDNVYEWSLHMNDYYIDINDDRIYYESNTFSLYMDCIEKMFREHSITEISRDKENFTVEATYNQIKLILENDFIYGIHLDLIEDICSSLSIEECDGNPFCHTLSAAPFDSAEKCYGSSQAVACRGTAGLTYDCGASVTIATDLDGLCWRFRDACIPEGWSRSGSQNDVDYVECGNFPSCED